MDEQEVVVGCDSKGSGALYLALHYFVQKENRPTGNVESLDKAICTPLPSGGKTAFAFLSL